MHFWPSPTFKGGKPFCSVSPRTSIQFFPFKRKLKMSFSLVDSEVVIGVSAAFGVTGGAHRLWTHRAYKAKLPLRIILAWCYITSGMVRSIRLIFSNSQHAIGRQLTFFHWNCRTRFSSGSGITGCTINFPKPTPIRTTPTEDSSFPIAAGSWLKSTRTSLNSAKNSTCPTWRTIRW